MEVVVINKSGPDGNALNIINVATDILGECGYSDERIKELHAEWTSSTYEDLCDDIEDKCGGYIEFVDE